MNKYGTIDCALHLIIMLANFIEIHDAGKDLALWSIDKVLAGESWNTAFNSSWWAENISFCSINK